MKEMARELQFSTAVVRLATSGNLNYQTSLKIIVLLEQEQPFYIETVKIFISLASMERSH